jgi:hypothetical protein
MTNQSQPAHSASHGGYERTDIGVALVVYFLIGLAVAIGVTYFIVDGVYHFLDKRFNATQTAVSPLVTNAPADTRRLPPEYTTDSKGRDYEKYLEKNFPQPQLETDEQTELNKIRLREEDTLSTYDYVDKSAGTVRIPIDRAMELIVQRGLPVRSQASAASAESKPAAKGTQQ